MEILDEDIRLVQEPRQLLPVAGLRERERDAELVGVEETVEPARSGEGCRRGTVRDGARITIGGSTLITALRGRRDSGRHRRPR